MKAPQLNELIRSRRSVFPAQFIPGKPVDKEIIEQVITNATWAPNHGQAEPWQFTVFSGKGLVKLSTFQSELYKQKAGEKFNPIKFEKLKNNPLLASHVIAIGMRRTTTKNIPEIEDIEAVACAVQNIYLTVSAYGLGGYWTTGGVTYYDEAKSFFGLNGPDKLLGFFYIGHVGIQPGAAKRSPLHEKVNWVDV
ncbi:MAG: nitroreductase [Ferruginibacter sp.]|nr:nitroreductase [Ferruginibacter sp.]